MVEVGKPVRVAVNVMRARLTVIGFNIAIVSFQIVNLYEISGGVRVPGVDHAVHVGASMALFMALALSLIALVAFLMSSAFDEVGVCTHWSLVAGDLLMYLALAHTVAGFFAPLTASIEIFSAKLPDRASEIAILHTASLVAGGVAWFLATYAGPAVSLLRSPFPRRTNIALGVAYLVVLLALSWVSSHAMRVEATGSGDEDSLVMSILIELVQPFSWQVLTLSIIRFFAALVPCLVMVFYGRFVLKMNPIIICGAITGNLTCTPGLNGVIEAAESNTPVLGYTVSYAISNVLLTFLGPVIVFAV